MMWDRSAVHDERRVRDYLNWEYGLSETAARAGWETCYRQPGLDGRKTDLGGRIRRTFARTARISPGRSHGLAPAR